MQSILPIIIVALLFSFEASSLGYEFSHNLAEEFSNCKEWLEHEDKADHILTEKGIFGQVSVDTCDKYNQLLFTVCSGDSVEVGGEHFYVSGTYTVTLTAEDGCDSIITLELTVSPPILETILVEICQGSTYDFIGQMLTTSGIYTAALTNAEGCDSIVKLVLIVNPALEETVTAEICQGATYVFNGQMLTVSGTYTTDLTNAEGCDSTVTLYLTVNPVLVETVTEEICYGDYLIWDNVILTQPGVYSTVLTSKDGCDSIVTLVLTVVPVLVTTIDSTFCEGKGITIWGQYFSMPGTFIIELTTSEGCDSLLIYTLTVEEVDVPVSIFENSLIADQSAASYQWMNCDSDEDIPGANGQSFIPAESGNYSVRVVLEDSCIGTSDCINFMVTGIADDNISNAVSVYPNPSDGMIHITNESAYPISSVVISTLAGHQIQTYKLSGENTLDLSRLEKGVYLITFELNHSEFTRKIVIK